MALRHLPHPATVATEGLVGLILLGGPLYSMSQ